ncbi:TolC family protein [Sphingomonas sp. RB3P16]|uniref:TolC family protein n=1 Tax=Parasphingomonas frigoris TaxID=3096163 RepID=UPI002FC5B9CB
MFGLAAPVAAQESGGPPVAMSFDAASQTLSRGSRALSGADHQVRAAQATADSLKALSRPVVSASASFVEYQKTLSLDLSGAKNGVTSATSDFLAGLPGQFPPGFQEIVSQVTQRVGTALPGLLSAIPDTLRLQTRDSAFRPTVTAALPLYTGGAIPAIQRGASAAVGIAQASQAQAQDFAQLNLVRTYFGQQVAAQLVASTRATRDGLDRHLSDARKLEQQGVLSHARVLEVQVARDAADRAFLRAELEAVTARDTLARLLDAEGGVQPTTALFVNAAPLPPKAQFLAGRDQPQAKGADAARAVAAAGVDLARSRYRPQAFAFGEYNLNRNDALPTEPDWIAGVAVRMTLLSNIDRRRTLDAAHERERAAADAAAEVRKTIATETIRAYDLAETARQTFLSLDSSVAAAEENLRVQQLSFREGEATSATVIDAQAAIATVRTQRIAAAYEYDLALAGLLVASHQFDSFGGYLARADHRLAP